MAPSLYSITTKLYPYIYIYIYSPISITSTTNNYVTAWNESVVIILGGTDGHRHYRFVVYTIIIIYNNQQ